MKPGSALGADTDGTSIDNTWTDQLVTRRQVRRAFVILKTTRTLYLVLAAAWLAVALFSLSASVPAQRLWVIALAGAVAPLALVCAVAVRSWRVLAGAQLALLSSVGLTMLLIDDLLDRWLVWLAIALVVVAWAAIIPLVRAQGLLAGEPTAIVTLARFAQATRSSRIARFERHFIVVLIIIAVATWWGRIVDYRAQQLPVALQPVLDDFAAAWNDKDDARLRQLITASPRQDAWEEFAVDLEKHGWEAQRPVIGTAPTAVLNYGATVRVQYSLGSSMLKTHWHIRLELWALEYLYISP